jgi:4,5-dihydroxyphthalate decarboxylase
MGDLELSLMVADYDRTKALATGEVGIDGVSLKVFPPPTQGAACYRPVYEMFDVVEMSLSWYVMARCRGEPLVALPIFPLRMFIQPYIFCSPNSGIEAPQDLKGKRLGMEQYRFTVGLWGRGILEEHHGVSPSDVQWVTSSPEGAGYEAPQNVKKTVQEKDVEQLLLDGQLDAVIAANVPRAYRAGDPRIRRLFPDCANSVQEYFDSTQIFPITHTLVLKESLLNKHPWLPGGLLAAFNEANRLCRERYQYPKRFSFPTAVLLREEQEKRFGKNPWSHGLSCNAHVLEKFVEYAQRQGYISSRPRLNDLFPMAETISSSPSAAISQPASESRVADSR